MSQFLPEGSEETMDMMRICHVACLLKRAICPGAGFSPLKGGEDLEAAIRQFGLLHQSGKYFLATDERAGQEEIEMMVKACDGLRVEFNNGRSRLLILPDPERLWNGYCKRRYAFGRKNAGAALMGAWMLAASTFRMKTMREGYFFRPEPTDGYLIASRLWYEATGFHEVKAGLAEDPVMYLLGLSARLDAALKRLENVQILPGDGRGKSLVIKGCRGDRVEAATAELKEQMKETPLRFLPAGSGRIIVLSDPPGWKCLS